MRRGERRRGDRRAPTRRAFLAAGLGAAAGLLLPNRGDGAHRKTTPVAVKPPRLRPGDLVALVNPGLAPATAEDVAAVADALGRLDLRAEPARHVSTPDVADADRAADINAAFADRGVRAVIPIRGGFGSARVLDHLDYAAIRRNPKVLMGFSDIAALLLAVHGRTGLVTFHGPMGISAWDEATVEHARDVLFEGGIPTYDAPSAEGHTLAAGRARGPLLAANLTVLTSLIGSRYLSGLDGAVLVLEEVREPLSEVDRMLTQLDLSGVAARAGALVFGRCVDCAAPRMDRALELRGVLDEHFAHHGIPSFMGAPVGHFDPQPTLPIGLPVKVDADRCRLEAVESAVV